MQVKRRKFLDKNEILRFNASNDFVIERYFDGKKDTSKFYSLELRFDHSYALIPESITIKAIYYDYSKSIEKYKNIEYINVMKLPVTQNRITKNTLVSVPVKLKENTKVLWKIILKITSKIDCELKISLIEHPDFDCVKALQSKIKKRTIESFKRAIPEIKEEVAKMECPLDFHDIVYLYRCIARSQITFDDLKPEIQEEFRQTTYYELLKKQNKV